MSWVIEKILIGRLRKFFIIEDDKNIQLSLISKRQLKCVNLILKTDAINNPTMAVLISYCSIGLLQISFDKKKSQYKKPLNVKVSNVKLVLKFNKNKIIAEDQKKNIKKQRPVLQNFYKAVGTQEEYQQRSFLQQQIFQLKQLFAQYALGELFLDISNIDISIEYETEGKLKYFGVEVQQISARQELVLKEVVENQQHQSSQIKVEIKSISAYFGLPQQDLHAFQQFNSTSQFMKRNQELRKKHILHKGSLNLIYNFGENKLLVGSKYLQIDFEDIFVYQALNLVNYLKSHLNDQPQLRPGQGYKKVIPKLGQHPQFEISQGSLIWWQRFGDNILERFKRKPNADILTNFRFRKYLFCLLYRYTYGAHEKLQKEVDQYEYFKTDLQVLYYNKLIISKVRQIQQSKNQNGVEAQTRLFLIFLLSSIKKDNEIKRMGLKKVDYKAIKNSNIIINYNNCKKYINMKQAQAMNSLMIDLNVQRICFNLRRPRLYSALKRDISGVPPSSFNRKKKGILQFYCKQAIQNREYNNQTIENSKTSKYMNAIHSKFSQQIKPQSEIYITIQISSIKADFNSRSNTHISIPLLEIDDIESHTSIVKISNLYYALENMNPQMYEWKMAADKRMEAKVDTIFVFAQSKFVEKLLTILGYINEVREQPEEQKNFIIQFIAKKVPNHPIFNTYQNTSIQVYIKSLIIATPVFHKDKTFEIDLKGIKYIDPVNGKPIFGVSQSLILRSNVVNLQNKVSPGHHTIKIEDQIVLMANTRQFSGKITKDITKNIISIVIPFILIQLACQDIYYISNIMKVWLKILSNPYYFPPKIIRKNQTPPQINPNSIKFARQMQKFSKNQTILDLFVEGIQLCLLSDYLNQGNNIILDLLIDTLSLKSISTYTLNKVQLKLRDIYIRNFLSFKTINKEALIVSIKDQLKYGDDPILTNKTKKQDAAQSTNEKMQKDEQLLLFIDHPHAKDSEQSTYFLNFNIKSEVSLKNNKSLTLTQIKIIPIYFFYSLQFTEMIRVILNTIDGLSTQNISTYETSLKNQTRGMPFSLSQNQTTAATLDTIQMKDDQQNVEILAASQFQQIAKLSVQIQKLNFLAVKNSSVVYTISLAQIFVKHKTQPYVQRFFFNANRMIIVDTSEESGPQPIIIDLKKMPGQDSYPMKGSFTTYKSQIMKFKQKKSAFFQLQIEGPQIHFLKKKVLQLVNFLMILLKQVGILPPPDQQLITKPKPNPNQPPLRYCIQIIHPKIKLLRSSLSKEGFKAVGNIIEVANYKKTKNEFDKDEEDQLERAREQSIIKALQDHQIYNQQSVFYDIDDQKEHDQIQFQSFQKLHKSKVNQTTTDTIYIIISQFHLYGFDCWNKEFSQLFNNMQIVPMLEIQAIKIQFLSPEMSLKIPEIAGCMGDDDFRVLMRLTQQNLSQSPLLFVDNPRVQTAIKMSFRTTFQIQKINLDIIVLQESLNKLSQKVKKKVTVALSKLTGKNQLWTNNQILTQVSIYELQLITTATQMKIVQRLHEQSLKQFPEIIKQNTYRDIQSHPQFIEMEIAQRRHLAKFLENQVGKVQIFNQNHPNDVILNENEEGGVQRTNTQKISQWVKGMLGKCCDRKKKKSNQEDLLENILGAAVQKSPQEQNATIPIKLKDNKLKNRTAPMIYRIEDVLDFDYELNYPLIEEKKKQTNMIYLNFIIRPNGERQMYMQAKQIQVLLENTKGLLGLAQFFGKPFAVSDIPENVRRYKFNNSKPFKMLIQVDDTLAQIRAEDQNGKIQRITILCDAVYDSEMRGDSTIGPGLSKMRVQSVAKIIFMSQNFKKAINLSDSFKLIFFSQAKVPYGDRERNETIQRILLVPQERRDWNLSFFIPSFALKAIYRIIMTNFVKIQEQDKLHEEVLQQKMNEQVIQQKKDEGKTIKKTLSYDKQTKINQPQLPQAQNMQKQTVVSRKASAGDEVVYQANNKDVVQQYKKKQLNKPTPPLTNKQMHLIRCVYVSQITFEIQSNEESSYIKSKITDIKYTELYINNKTTKINTRNCLATVSANYWNLKLGVYEPCIEPWKFKVEQIVHQRDNLSSSHFKICSNLDAWNKVEDGYVNDLNINISIGLYQTFKQLNIVFDQESYDMNDQCIDLTTFEGSDYDTLFNRIKKNIILQKDRKRRNPQKKLSKYFTRVFKYQNQNLKKYLANSSQIYFNPPNLRLFLYHSYFDHFRRKKCITYRTPYRIFNSTNVDIMLWFYDPKRQQHNKVLVRMFQYFAIPQTIYQYDYLVHFTDDLESGPPPKGSPYISVKYLIQMKGRMRSFKKVDPQSIIWKNIFKYSSTTTQKLVDHRDMILRVGQHSFTAINVFSKHQPKQEQQNEVQDLKFYDAYCILQSPIMIDNFTYIDFKIKVDRTNEIVIPKNQRVEINSNLRQNILKTIIEFTNDTLHEQRKIFYESYGYNRKIMQIDKLQSVKLLITRQTTSLVLIKIWTDWNVTNYTKQAFNIKNRQKIMLIDPMSFNCLSNLESKGIDICIINQQKHNKKIKPNNIADVVTLAKRKVTKQRSDYDKLMQAKVNYKRSKCCGCWGSTSDIYQHIDFVLNAVSDPIQPLQCQKVEIRYRYMIVNKTPNLIKFCQFSNDFVIAQMPPYVQNTFVEPKYLYFYDFLPAEYLFEIQIEDEQTKVMKKINSYNFNLEQFPGSTFTIKIKKQKAGIQLQQYQNRFYYFQIDIKKREEQTLIQINVPDFKDFPIYIDNVTNYQIKIVEGEDQFILKPKKKIHFAWSTLSSQKYRLQASINEEQGKQVYEFNNKSAFEPIKLKDKSNRRKKKQVQNLYLRENCYVIYEYMSIATMCLVILDLFDNKLRIHNKDYNINTQVDMTEVQRLQPLASKIQLHFKDQKVIELMPPGRTIKTWIQKLQQCISEDVADKIFFTIESYNNSRLFFFRTAGNEEYESSKQQYSISHLYVSLISPLPQQIILLYCGDIAYIQHDKQNKLNHQDLQLSESQKILTIKKIKINNQTKDAVNPVVLSQIKKSNYPCIQLRLIQQKLHLQAQAKGQYTTNKQLQLKQQEEKIAHYREITFFMDQAEVMVQAALFLKIFALKKNFDHVTNQYAVGNKMEERDVQIATINQINEVQQLNKELARPRQSSVPKINSQQQQVRKSIALVNIPAEQDSQKKKPQVYINYLQIKPLKITLSVYLDHNQSQDIQINIISILRYIPFGIENAIIQIDSYQFFHVFYDMDELKKQLMKFYKKQAFNQIYKNAGSYDMFVPIQLIGGVGNGVKKIFYDPIYELVRKKEIKAVGKSFFEGILSFFAFLVGFFFKIINLAFKIIALLTFDQVYKTRRQSFRKQIFKSPVQGAVLGAKNFWSVFKSVFTNFTMIKKNYGQYSVFGYVFGFIVCILKIAPWAVKLVVSFYDWLYVIGLGLINWGYYEQSAMKSRSRPRRKFFHKQIVPYDYKQALGSEIILKNQLQQIQNEQIQFVKSVQGNDDTNYLILSNYRIIHNYDKLTAMKQIKLYQVRQVQSVYNEKKQYYKMRIFLSIPNVHKVLFLFSYNVSKYSLKFAQKIDIVNFLKNLKHSSIRQKLGIRFIDSKAISKQINPSEMLLFEILDQHIQAKKQQQYELEENIKERDRQFKHLTDVEDIVSTSKKNTGLITGQRILKSGKQLTTNMKKSNKGDQKTNLSKARK